jgi:hypothetical protein
VETGADVPSYSGGLAAWLVVSDAGFSVAGGADPGSGAERLAERLVGGAPAANQRFRSHCLEGCGSEITFKSGRRDVGVPGASTTVRSLSDVICLKF